MVPRPLSRPHHLLGRLPSYGELARTRTAASERSRSRLTGHGARDDTRHKSCDISRQRASTHALALAPSCTRLCSGSAPTPRSRSPPAPTTYARLQPHLPTAELQAPRAARRGFGHCSRGSSRGWSPELRGCPRSRASRHPRRGGHPVAPQLSWAMLVVSLRLGAPRHRRSLPIGSSCSDEVGSLAGAWREAVSKPPPRLRLPTPSPRRTPRIGASSHLRCPLAEKGSFPKVTLDPP